MIAHMKMVPAILTWLLILQGSWPPTAARAAEPGMMLAAASPSQSPAEGKSGLSPEEKMNRRFPQPIRVGDLVGLPVLDGRDATIGYVRQVVRGPDGKIQLVVPYGRWFGWVALGGAFDRYRRLVGVPLERVAMLGRQVAALDMPREDFDNAPAFDARNYSAVPHDDIIKIAITRR
jgi:hypothetical protein